MLKAMMTADQLGIEQWEKDALIWLRDQLIEGKISHLDLNSSAHSGGSLNLLNMAVVYSNGQCGTICCIGGWLGLYGKVRFIESYVANHKRLNYLFYPTGDNVDLMNKITEKEVILTIDHFLYTGEIIWNLEA